MDENNKVTITIVSTIVSIIVLVVFVLYLKHRGEKLPDTSKRRRIRRSMRR